VPLWKGDASRIGQPFPGSGREAKRARCCTVFRSGKVWSEAGAGIHAMTAPSILSSHSFVFQSLPGAISPRSLPSAPTTVTGDHQRHGLVGLARPTARAACARPIWARSHHRCGVSP